jgi:photosystem II stability/assembly factor-like uncharacterized protein
MSTSYRNVFPALLVALFLSAGISGCKLRNGLGPKPKSPPGFAALHVGITPHTSVLIKKSSADTIFTLDSLIVILTANGADTQTYSYPINGRPDTGAIAFETPTYTLKALRNWKAKILTIDTTMNPDRRDTVNLDSVIFAVGPGDTARASLTLSAIYSILRARLVSNSPESLPYTIKYLRIRVDGVRRDSVLVGDNLKGMDFPAAATGYAVGRSGVIWKSTNTGDNWVELTSGTPKTLNAVSFTSTTAGWTVGDDGTILVTSDGSSWNAQTSGTGENLRAVWMASSTVGGAAGTNGTILRTGNGGGTWTAQTSGTTKNFNGMMYQSTSRGWVVGDSGTILRTTNSGSLWSAQNSGTTVNLRSVYFTNGNNGRVVGDSGVILTTSNGGGTWTKQISGTTSNLYSVYMQSSTVGWAAGAGGTLLKTNGTSWTAQSSGTEQTLRAVVSTNNTVAHAAGATATVVNTANGGTAWTPMYLGTKVFDKLLTYKYLTPSVTHTLILGAIDTLDGPLRGYQATLTLHSAAGLDTTVPSASLVACGGSNPACIP